VVYSKNKQRLRHLQTQGTPLPGPGKIFDDQCFIYGALEVLARVGFILQVWWDADEITVQKSL
jgi:hypothetical protein